MIIFLATVLLPFHKELQHSPYNYQKSPQTPALLSGKPVEVLYAFFLHVFVGIDSDLSDFFPASLPMLQVHCILQLEILFLTFLTVHDTPNNKILWQLLNPMHN